MHRLHFHRPQFSSTRKKAVLLALAALTIGAVIGSTGTGSAATTVAPKSTSPTTVSGTASLGSTLTASHGTFSGSTPIGYTYQWRRCDITGGSCSDIDKATKTTYTLAKIDVGNTMRAVATAKNKDGSDSSTSVPTAVVTAPAPAPATGCPTGTGSIAVADLGLPARLNVDSQAISPAVVLRSSTHITVRLHVTACVYVHEAAKRGVFAYIIDGTPDELQSAIDITLQRFAEYQNLQGAFGRRALIEQAKGILMARNSTTADRAYEMLREHSQHNGRKLSDVAAAVVESHLLLLPAPTPSDRPD